MISLDYSLGSALARTTNGGRTTNITLSPNAAGHGWFIDLTPSDNAEFLPTSNPLEWIARPGSDAESRMDLLTVLLHEYGHAARLDHAPDSHDLMASTLAAGVRRLPSISQLAALSGLHAGTDSAQVSYDPSTPPGAPLPLSRSVGSLRLNRVRPSEPPNSPGDRLSAVLTQFSIVANPTLANPSFRDGSSWSTFGEVVFAPGSATLKESATAQTRLSQAFVLGDNDSSLSFTLSNIALDDVDAAPDDAVEVALIDASTGMSLLAGTGLADNDAILNLQADGREHKAAGVTTTRNPDGSLSVIVDLSGIAAGTVVNLSFDLIGFGRGTAAASSQVTVRDLRLGGGQSIETRDDVASTKEDTPLIIDVIGNDLGADTAGVTPLLVDDLTHGDLAVNADGSFAYTPQANWHGDDRFTYRLIANGVESNVATVSVMVTPVNDAPILAEITNVTVLEGERFATRAAASDVDPGDVLHYTLDTAPTGATIDPLTGDIAWRAIDGDASYDFSVRVSDDAGESATRQFTVNVLNVAPTLTAAGLQATYANEDFTLELSSSDAGDDTIARWQIDWGDGQIDEILDLVGLLTGNPAQLTHRYSGVLGEVLIRATASDEDGSYSLDPLPVVVLPPPLQISSFSYDYGGFAVRFNDIFDSRVINLYNSVFTRLDAADIVLVGGRGVVKGSLVIDADYRGLRYVVSGDGLSADTYSLTLKSGAQAFHGVWSALDGNADGVAGDDYRTTFTLGPLPATRLSLPDFMRGPGQTVDVPTADRNLPLTLVSPGGVQQLSFAIRFDPALLLISGASPGADLPADASLAIDSSLAGEFRVSIVSPTAIAAGRVTLLHLVASVPVTAPYGARQMLDIQQVSINSQALAGADRDALHVVGYPGDADGNASRDSSDLYEILANILRSSVGFSSWSQVDPLLLGDVDLDDRSSLADRWRVARETSSHFLSETSNVLGNLQLTHVAPQLWPDQPGAAYGLPQIDFGINFTDFVVGSDDPRARRENWKKSFVTQLASSAANPNSSLQVTLEASPQATPSVSA